MSSKLFHENIFIISRAVTRLYSVTPATKKHFLALIAKVIRKEIKVLIKQKDLPLNKEFKLENLASFSWTKTLKETRKVAPVLYNALLSSVTKPANENSLIG